MAKASRGMLGTAFGCMAALMVGCTASPANDPSDPESFTSTPGGKADDATTRVWGHNLIGVTDDGESVWIEVRVRSSYPVLDSIRPELQLGDHRFVRSERVDSPTPTLRFRLTRAEWASLPDGALSSLRTGMFNRPGDKADESGVPAPTLKKETL